MKAPLKCYLTDHLAGAAMAIRMLESLRAHYAGDPVGRFADDLLHEITADEKTLADLVARLEGSAGGWKRRLARFLSSLGARKFVAQEPEPFGAFEALETLAIGIQGKLALWRTLELIAEARFAGINFEELRRRAASQHAAVEGMRLTLAKQAFATRGLDR